MLPAEGATSRGAGVAVVIGDEFYATNSGSDPNGWGGRQCIPTYNIRQYMSYKIDMTHALPNRLGKLCARLVFHPSVDARSAKAVAIVSSANSFTPLDDTPAASRLSPKSSALVALLASLIFVGLQIRQNTQSQRVVAVESLATAIAAINVPAMQSPALGTALATALKDWSLASHDERVIAHYFLFCFFKLHEQAFRLLYQYEVARARCMRRWAVPIRKYPP